MSAFRSVRAAAALAVLGVASWSQAAPFGYNDDVWGNSIGSYTMPDPYVSPMVIPIDAAVANGWAANPSSFHGVAVAPSAPHYYGNIQMPGTSQSWKHETLSLTFSDGSTATYDQTGQQAAMIAPIAYTNYAGVVVDPNLPAVGTSWIGDCNNPWMVLYNWNLDGQVSGKTVTAASVTIQNNWSEKGISFDTFAVPAAWTPSTVTYNSFVPEPATMGLLGLGGLLVLRRRRD